MGRCSSYSYEGQDAFSNRLSRVSSTPPATAAPPSASPTLAVGAATATHVVCTCAASGTGRRRCEKKKTCSRGWRPPQVHVACNPLRDMRDAPWTRCRAATHDDNDLYERREKSHRRQAATYRNRPCLLIVYWHLFSLLGCCAAVGLAAKSAISAPEGMVVWVDYGNQTVEDRGPLKNTCFVWTASAISDLCERNRWQRLQLMRDISLFQADCEHAAANVQLSELFRLDWRSIKSDTDLLSHTEHLQPGDRGRDCVMSRAGSQECSRCFHRLSDNLRQLDVAYNAFNRTLHRFDCMLAVDSSSATRPFSPNGSCTDCKLWYRKWLLVQLVDMWKEPPCINWCYYAQLACPHLATSKVVDYAGHPSFQCRDLHIPLSGSPSAERSTSSCHCVHPCDLHPERDPLRSARSSAGGAQAVDLFDFFAAREHCSTRRQQCEKERRRAIATERVTFPVVASASNTDERGDFNEVAARSTLPPQARNQRVDDNRVYRHRPPRRRPADTVVRDDDAVPNTSGFAMFPRYSRQKFNEYDPAELPFLMKIEPNRAIYYKGSETLADLEMTNSTKVLQTFQARLIRSSNSNVVNATPPSGYIKPGEKVVIKVSTLKEEYYWGPHWIAFLHKPAKDKQKSTDELWQPTSKPEGVKRIPCFFNFVSWFHRPISNWSDLDVRNPFLLNIEPNKEICFRAEDSKAQVIVSEMKITNTTKDLQAFWIFHTPSLKFLRIIPPYGYLEPGEAVNIELTARDTTSTTDRCLLYIVHDAVDSAQMPPDKFWRMYKYITFQGYKSLQCNGFSFVEKSASSQRTATIKSTASSQRSATTKSAVSSQRTTTTKSAASSQRTATTKSAVSSQRTTTIKPIASNQPTAAASSVSRPPPIPKQTLKRLPTDPLIVRPFDDICFFAKDLTAQKNNAHLSVTNTTKMLLTFKIKCTSKKIFRLRPPHGYISPGQTVTIKVSATFKTMPDKRHVILFCYMATENANKPARELWKTATNGISTFKHAPQNQPGEPLMVRPCDYVYFCAKNLLDHPNYVYVSITNTTTVLQTFKVESTSNEIFSLWPSLDYVSPGETVTIRVTATLAAVPRNDRHSIVFYHKPAEDTTKPARELWKPTFMPVEGVVRVRCRYKNSFTDSDAICVFERTMKRLISCFWAILLLFEGATSSDAGPVRLVPLQYWRGTPAQPTGAESCTHGTELKRNQEVLGIYFNLFKGERGYATLGDEKTLKKQAAECLRSDKLDNFKFTGAELHFTFPLSQDARCVMWFVLAMRRSGLRYTLDTRTKTFNISLREFTKGKGCTAKALPTPCETFRFCIVKQCDSENDGDPRLTESPVIYDSRATNSVVNPIFNDFCDLECRYESYQIKEAANGAQIVVKPKKGYTTLVTNPSGTTAHIKRAVSTVYLVITIVTLIGRFIPPILGYTVIRPRLRNISTMMRSLIDSFDYKCEETQSDVTDECPGHLPSETTVNRWWVQRKLSKKKSRSNLRATPDKKESKEA
ncbi:hypothetical protein QR680_018982 [Steinernema hermaphroditum]|uniref:MSP domain-containing protein n=1 Tax=Steinernema hermaphroditum TaxID=289476 RepID=A0AA39LRN7_9BILA|nr:hypothetical protein QR680_018982 [Steinernema hermaphroditum]